MRVKSELGLFFPFLPLPPFAMVLAFMSSLSFVLFLSLRCVSWRNRRWRSRRGSRGRSRCLSH